MSKHYNTILVHPLFIEGFTMGLTLQLRPWFGRFQQDKTNKILSSMIGLILLQV
jgi:hypothetical protein